MFVTALHNRIMKSIDLGLQDFDFAQI